MERVQRTKKRILGLQNQARGDCQYFNNHSFPHQRENNSITGLSFIVLLVFACQEDSIRRHIFPTLGLARLPHCTFKVNNTTQAVFYLVFSADQVGTAFRSFLYNDSEVSDSSGFIHVHSLSSFISKLPSHTA